MLYLTLLWVFLVLAYLCLLESGKGDPLPPPPREPKHEN